jgi:hypothetical protein
MAQKTSSLRESRWCSKIAWGFSPRVIYSCGVTSRIVCLYPTCIHAGWPACAHHSCHHRNWPQHAAESLARTWLPAWCVPCYAWSAYWTFVMRLKKLCEFSFSSVLIVFTCVVSNLCKHSLKSGTSFWLILYIGVQYTYSDELVIGWKITQPRPIQRTVNIIPLAGRWYYIVM